MYSNGPRHVLGNDSSRTFPPPPPPMSPPVVGGTMNTMMGAIPPPPPRYAPAQNRTATPNVLIPPPPSGPPPGSALNQQPPWHGGFGRIYDGRSGFLPPPGQQHHAPYNPQIHAALNAGHNIPIPPPPEQLVGATYIPSGDTFGEGVGIPAFGPDDYAMPPISAQPSWSTLTPPSTTDTNITTPLDEQSTRDRFPTLGTTATTAPTTTIAPETIAQWPLDTVLLWLAKNQFSQEWQDTFKALDISGSQFLEMGVKKGSHKTSQMIHLHVYPRLKEECLARGTTFDQAKEREEVKRMRRLINNILTGKTLDPSKVPASHVRKGSMTNGTGHTFASLPSAGTDPSESPSVSASPSKPSERFY